MANSFRRPLKSFLRSDHESEVVLSDRGTTSRGESYAEHVNDSAPDSTGAHALTSDPASGSKTVVDQGRSLSGSNSIYSTNNQESGNESSFRSVAEKLHLLYWLAAVPSSLTNESSAEKKSPGLASAPGNTATIHNLDIDVDREKLNKLLTQIQDLATRTPQGPHATKSKCSLSDVEAKLATIVQSEPIKADTEKKPRVRVRRSTEGVTKIIVEEEWDSSDVRAIQTPDSLIHPTLTSRSNPTTQAAHGSYNLYLRTATENLRYRTM